MCMHTKSAHVPHNMLRKVKVQIARWQQRSTLVSYKDVKLI